MSAEKRRKSVQELEEPVVKLDIDYSKVDTEPEKERPMGRDFNHQPLHHHPRPHTGLGAAGP